MMVATSSPFVALERCSTTSSSTAWPRTFSSGIAPSSMTSASRRSGVRSPSARAISAWDWFSAKRRLTPASPTIHSIWSCEDVS